jgi:Flp pilus assembly pilin Flp
MLHALRRTTHRLRDERGASLVEYCLLVALVALVCVGALTFFGSSNGAGIVRSSSCITAAQDQQALPEGC